ncbi:hypothetical protein C1N81_10295 [Streptomyces sp. SGAir0957]
MFEAWAALLLAVFAVLVAPAAGAAGGWAAHEDALDHARAQQQSRQPQRARLIEDAPDYVPAATGVQTTVTYPVAVRWTDAEGRTVTAVAPVTAGLERGDATTVWLDRRGAVTAAPWGGDDVWSHTLAAGFLVAAATAGLALVTRLVLRAALDRRRLAAWEREWSRVEPVWGRRHA